MLTDEVTAGGIRTTVEKKKQLAAESIAYNFKKEAQFVELFGDWFEQIGLDPVNKRPVQRQASGAQAAQEERKDSNPIQAFQEAL